MLKVLPTNNWLEMCLHALRGEQLTSEKAQHARNIPCSLLLSRLHLWPSPPLKSSWSAPQLPVLSPGANTQSDLPKAVRTCSRPTTGNLQMPVAHPCDLRWLSRVLSCGGPP